MRLARVGKKNAPQFRIVIQEKSKAPSSSYIDNVGTYNPLTNPATITLKEDQIKAWIAKGCQPSNTVWNMLVEKGVVEGKKRKSVAIKKKKGKDEKKKESEAKPASTETPTDKPEEKKAKETKEKPTEENKTQD